MNRRLDNKETYLFGTLLALVREQLEAVEKLHAGKLGWWGRGRMAPRSQTMGKFMRALLAHKAEKGVIDPLAEVSADLEFIERDDRTWSDVTPREIEFVRDALAAHSAIVSYLCVRAPRRTPGAAHRACSAILHTRCALARCARALNLDVRRRGHVIQHISSERRRIASYR